MPTKCRTTKCSKRALQIAGVLYRGVLCLRLQLQYEDEIGSNNPYPTPMTPQRKQQSRKKRHEWNGKINVSKLKRRCSFNSTGFAIHTRACAQAHTNHTHTQAHTNHHSNYKNDKLERLETVSQMVIYLQMDVSAGNRK